MSKKQRIRENDTADTEKRSDSGINEASLLSDEPEIQRTIEITIDSIENISSIKMIGNEDFEICVRVQHDDITLGESQSMKLGNDEADPALINIDYTVPFTVVVNKQSSIGAAISTPILITALESFGKHSDGIMSPADNYTSAGEFGNKNKGTRSSALKLKGLRGNQAPVVLGICNFDLMPLMLGEKVVTEKLLLEVPISGNAGDAIISWEYLPRLNVSAKLLDEDIFSPDMKVNFLTITVESIYNLPSSFTDDMDYKASTVTYEAKEVPDDIIFEGGVRTNVSDTEKTKCWQSLAHLEGRAKFSKYKLNSDITKNDAEVDIRLLDSAPRVQWNSMSRSSVLHSGSEAMSNMIKRYKYWPFFFAAIGKTRDLSKQKAKEADHMLLFQCYANVSELLYPGTTRTRTVAQLHTFSISAMAEQTGLDKCVFEREISKEPAVKEKELKKGKSSTKGSSLPMTAAVSTESEYVPSLPLVSENGQPVLVIIEFELHHPLQPARTLEDLTDRIDQMVHPYISPPNPYTSDLAEEHYSNCIRKLVDTLCGEYQNFSQSCSMPNISERTPRKVSSPAKILAQSKDPASEQTTCDQTAPSNKQGCTYSYIKDEIECFIQYLHETGTYLSVRSTLKNKITMLMDQKFKIEMPTLNTKECQNFVATTYIYLVEQMHCTLNKVVEGQHAEGFPHSSAVSSSSFFAEESCALGYMDDARKEYLDMITRDKRNPDTWIEYAIYLIGIKDIDRATECCREAIALNKQHKIALLLYGLILSREEQYHDAEIFLQTVTQVYPRFTVGWAILHLFYLRTEYFPGADVTMQVAQKCMKDKDPDVVTMPFVNREPLLWTTLNYPKERIYLVTAVLLMKLSCLDFAGIALAQELIEVGRTRHLLYYVAVQHYIENRYEDAICHLKEAEKLHGMEYSVASLMGHCHLQQGNFDEAICCYEFANSSFDRPEDLHLVQLRLGYLYLSTDRYDTARRVFLIVCKNSPTCRSWLGVGIASYHLSDMKNAEKSLTEANSLNTYNAEVWGYLCLVNMSLQRYDEFLQCYGQVVKNNLTNVRVWTMIKDLMESLDYTTPLLSIDSEESLIQESLGNEGDPEAYQESDENWINGGAIVP